MAERAQRERRVWMAMGAARARGAALEAAVELARMLDAELAGLFVEEADLLRSAALPFATELTLFSAARRPLAPAELERALRAQAEDARRSLAEAAALAGLRWSFRAMRGETLQAALEAAAGTECVVVPPPELAPAIRSSPAARGRSAAGAPRLLALQVELHDGEEVRRRAGELLDRLAAMAGPALPAGAHLRARTSVLRILLAPRPADTAGIEVLRRLLGHGAPPLVIV